MKASAFAYARATSVVNALELLAAHGDKAKVLSGGQSLMPAMNLRLISPEFIVDIGELAELRGIAVKGDVLTIGALTRHVDVLKSPEIAAHAPLLTDAIAHVAHPAIRNRGTIGGSLAHADPASELPACMLALDATIIVRGSGGERRIAAEEFFTGIYETALSPQELLVAIELPSRERIPRISSMNSPGVTATTPLSAWRRRRSSRADGSPISALAFFAVGDRPLLAGAAGKLVNVAVTPDVLSDASAALDQELDPQEDQQATPAMRRHLAKVLLSRCVSTLLVPSRSACRERLRDGRCPFHSRSMANASTRMCCRGSIWRIFCGSI